MDAATAAMGCTPAYLAIVVQNLAEAGAAEGLEPEQAYELVLETLRRDDRSAAPLRPDHGARSPSPRAAAAPRRDSKRSPTPASPTGFKAAFAASLERMRQ